MYSTPRRLLSSTRISRRGGVANHNNHNTKMRNNHGYSFSIQSLLDLAKQTTTPQRPSTTTATTTDFSEQLKEYPQLQSQQRQQLSSLQEQRIETGILLLSEVEIRLQRQCIRLQRYARSVLSCEDGAPFVQNNHHGKTTVNIDESSSSSSPSSPRQSAVIRTSDYHTPLWRQEQSNSYAKQQRPSVSSSSSRRTQSEQQQQQQQQQQSHFKNAAVKGLETLERIHIDTAEICRTVLGTARDAYSLDPPSSSPYHEKTLARSLMETAKQIQARHARSVETMAEIVVGLRKMGDPTPLFTETDNGRNLESKEVLRRSIMPFLQERLGIQLLCEHYVEMCKDKEKHQKMYTLNNNNNQQKQQQQQQQNDQPAVNFGTFDKDRSVSDAVRDAMGEAKILTEAYYDEIPEFEIGSIIRSQVDERNKYDKMDREQHSTREVEHVPVHATFVGPWLHYVLVELLKNATTATMERHDEAGAKVTNNDVEENDSHVTIALPSIQIHIIQNNDWTTISIEDQGVGIPPTDDASDGISTKEFTTSHPFVLSTFRFGNTDKLWDRLDEQTTYAMVRSPLRGMGVGLALSACMMQHFGGTLRLESPTSTDKHGNPFGTRAILQLPRDLTILEKTFDNDSDDEVM